MRNRVGLPATAAGTSAVAGVADTDEMAAGETRIMLEALVAVAPVAVDDAVGVRRSMPTSLTDRVPPPPPMRLELPIGIGATLAVLPPAADISTGVLAAERAVVAVGWAPPPPPP